MIPQQVPPFLIRLGEFGIDSGIYGLMNTRWGWPIAEVIHFFGLCLLMASVGMFDLRMMGLVRGISLAGLHRLVPFGILGFLLCVATGLLFVLSSPLEYIYNPAWQLKMLLMAVAGANMLTFYLTATSKQVNTLGPDDQAPLAARVIAIVSLASWLGVITCGRVITAFRPFME
ncbi:MAG: hypothetical protein J7494_09995 [Sphingobium sp.]|nr:hypothetical protein [Sphingobium sp.]